MNTNMTLEKRILSVLLTVIMVFSMVPLSVFAADGNQASVFAAGGEAEVTLANGSTINFNAMPTRSDMQTETAARSSCLPIS